MVLGPEKVSDKINEITAIPNLLALLDIKDCIVTKDGMSTQKGIAQQICNQGGDYILALKGNHGLLLEDTDMFVQDAMQTEFYM
jgi:predicted transposase YbfD/YdcC